MNFAPNGRNAALRPPGTLQICLLDGQAVTRCAAVGTQHAARLRRQNAVEGQLFDADMVMEILQVSHVPHRRAGVRTDLRSAMQRQVHAAGVAQCADLEDPGDPEGAGDIGLQTVHRVRVEHLLEIR